MATDTTTKPRSALPVDVEVGSRIRQMRLIAGMSQEKLGDAVGVTFQQIQKYEKGSNRIGASRLIKIADGLKVDAAEIVKGLSQFDCAPSDNALAYHNTGNALKMSKALSGLKPHVQSAMVDLARSIKSEAQA